MSNNRSNLAVIDPSWIKPEVDDPLVRDEARARRAESSTSVVEKPGPPVEDNQDVDALLDIEIERIRALTRQIKVMADKITAQAEHLFFVAGNGLKPVRH